MERLAYSLSTQMVRLIGHVENQRPVLEAVFHRLLVYPAPSSRLEAVRAVKKLVSEPEGLLDLTGPLLVLDKTPQNDMALIIMIIDSLEECSVSGNSKLQFEAIDTVVVILELLETFCSQGHILSEEQVRTINEKYCTIADSTYTGPLTYSSEDHLPKVYKEIISEEKLAEDIKQENHSEETLSQVSIETESFSNELPVLSDEESSEDTEGPEEGFDNDEDERPMDVFLKEAEQIHREDAQIKMSKIPKKLHSPIEPISEHDIEQLNTEKNSAATYLEALTNFIPTLYSIRSTIEIDQKIQEFSSKFCQDFSTESPLSSGSCSTIINADGIYLATYSSLHLNVRLTMEKFYQKDVASRVSPISEKTFVDGILGCGVLVYLSAVWLSEVYCYLLKSSLFDSDKDNLKSPLINILADLDGMGSTEEFGQLLREYKRLELIHRDSDLIGEIDAGKKLTRRILTACWENIISIFSHPLGNDDQGTLMQSSIGMLLGAKNSHRLRRAGKETKIKTLQGLRCLAKLTKYVGLQNRCGSVFCLLANAACPVSDKDTGGSRRKKKSRKDVVKIYPEILLSMEILLCEGVEIASHAQDCWKYVFRCCQYISNLEQNQPTPFLTIEKAGLSFPSPLSSPSHQRSSERVNLGDTGESINKILAKYVDKQSNNALSQEDTSKAINLLSQHIEKLFDAAATKLNMESYNAFLAELCFHSHKELICLYPQKNQNLSTKLRKQGSVQEAEKCLFINNISEVVLKSVRSGRPLIHLMKAWAIIGPCFMEAACHLERRISKDSVQALHDMITSLLYYNAELPYFHFNESLFKPFEYLIQLELCDHDVQDQIVTSMCDFVEGSTAEIRSGWRPLFGALRSIKMSDGIFSSEITEISHLRAVLDVFEAFLSTDNIVVFANAALDCITCLIKHIKGTEERRVLEELVDIKEMGIPVSDTCEAALRYLVRCHSILAKIYLMSASPRFQGAQKIKIGPCLETVSPNIPGHDVISFDPDTDTVGQFGYSFRSLDTSLEKGGKYKPLLQSDQTSELLRVWFLLMDGIVSAMACCPKQHQSAVVSTLFSILQSFKQQKYFEFGIFCVNHLLLPAMQTWLRKTKSTFRGWDLSAQGIKQALGMTTDLVLDWMLYQDTNGLNSEQIEQAIDLLLKQLLILLVESTVFPCEIIARFSCSCLRHLIHQTGPKLTPDHWNLVCLSLSRASQLSLYHLHQLMALFLTGSENFYGDTGTVRVAARRDSTIKETHRLKQLAHQILLLDSQRDDIPKICGNPEAIDRSFLFLLQPRDETTCVGEFPLRVTLGELLTSLTSHNIILQIIGSILLQGTKHLVPSLANILLQSCVSTPMSPSVSSLPGMLESLSSSQIDILLSTLKISHQAAIEFDSRPGLKFLIQKVCQIPSAANLYKQAGAAWSLRAVTLFDLCLSEIRKGDIKIEDIKQCLFDHAKTKNTLAPCDEGDKPMTFFGSLHDAFLEICDMYVDIILDKDGKRKQIDKISSEQIFFFSIEADDFHEMMNEDVFNKTPDRENEAFEDGSDRKSVCSQSFISTGDCEEKPSPGLPFQFSDFTRQPNRPDSPNLSHESDSEMPPQSFENLPPRTCGDGKEKEEVLKINTGEDVNSMMSQYKIRKQQSSMPAVAPNRENPFSAKRATTRSLSRSESIDPEIEQQRVSSLQKDSEAQTGVWNELVVLILDLGAQLEDREFQIMLPLIFPGVKALTAHAQDENIKQQIAEFFYRVANVYGFSDM